MDDLYDNLENYQDENIIDELKNENKDLKAKLEEYSTAMIRLQNDFDKLNSEYKKLEMNYSSLLKTARAEIERKSEMIKSLNSEKDLLIIKTLQSSGRHNFNARRHMHDSQWSNKSHECTGKPLPDPQLTAANQNEKSQRNNRIISSQTQSEETTSSLENKSNLSEDKELRDTKNYARNKTDKKNNATNEILKDVPMQCHKTKGEEIFNRRKSMLMSSRIEPIFSSDDDFEALNLKDIRKSPLKEDIRYYEKYSNRDNYYHSSMDRCYSNKTNRYTDCNRYDKYESGSKYTRHSPEKYRTKNIKEHSETHKLRSDYKSSRQRALRSPPTDKYNRSKSRDRRTFDRENYYEKLRKSPHNYDSGVKHKIRNELEEPCSKRQKTEFIKKSTIEENMYNNDREKELCLRNSFTKQQDFSTCQSPDYVNNDSTHVVKEIKHTAVCPLEDPRVSSKKLATKSKERVSTVDIKPVDVTMWDMPNIEKFKIPSTLTTKLPIKPDKQFVDEINMDIENPLLNDSLESGEIQSLNDCDSRYTEESDVGGGNKTINKNNEQSEKSNSIVIDCNNTKNPAINKYKIPKVKKPDKIYTGVKHDSLIPLSKKIISTGNYCNENKEEGEIHDKGKVCNLSQSTSISVSNDTVKLKQYKHSEMIKPNCGTVLPVKTLVAAGTLADDLELSDEASESTDLQKDVKESKNSLTKDKISIYIHHQKSNRPLVKDENKNSESKDKGKHISLKKIPKDSRDSCKTRKIKKKIDQKEASSNEAKEQTKELKTVPKFKDKQSKPVMSIQTKNKFSDLFGDSSSLITPDDLGIPPPEIQLPLVDKYSSIYDNTQDAVDLSVVDIKKAQSNTSQFQDDLSNEKTIKGKADSDNTLVSKIVDISAIVNNLSHDSLYTNATATINEAPKIDTVIISTGVQPNCTTDNITLEDNQQDNQKNCTEHIEEINSDMVQMTKCRLNNLKALATSTPHKPQLEDGSIATLGPNGSNDTSKITENANLSANVSNSSNPDDTVNEADIPDVRIFVRRRRKIIKKP